MSLIQVLLEMASLSVSVFKLITAGLTFAGLGYIAHHITDWLATHTRLNPPDPTVWQRSWRRLFDRYFHPVGERALNRGAKPVLNHLRYQLAIGLVAVAAIMGIYVIGSLTTVAGMVFIQYTIGPVPSLTPTIEQFAAVCVVLGIAIIFHATERGRKVAY